METTLSVLTTDGTEAGSFELDPGCIELEKGDQAVHDDVVSFLARMRAGTASTKTRGEVRGGGAKPWRQKGTGRARAGSIRSPIWRGGGTTFGPRPRSYTKHVNKKVRQLALKRAFSERLKDGDVIAVAAIDLADARTKSMISFLKTIKAGDDALVIVHSVANDVLLASRNLPGVEIMKAEADRKSVV